MSRRSLNIRHWIAAAVCPALPLAAAMASGSLAEAAAGPGSELNSVCFDITRSNSRSASPESESSAAKALSVNGDFRLRYEYTGSHLGVGARERGVLRARIAAEYRLSDRLSLGTRIVTGDADDPNSTDTTIGEFFDDLELSLDRAYVQYAGDSFIVTGGKFPNPFETTEIVWDGDINPQGVAVSYEAGWSRIQSRAIGMFSIIDESPTESGSTMAGAQLAFDIKLNDKWSTSISGAYYDFDIGSLGNANAGDIRDNFLASDGTRYLSDFDLVDVVAGVYRNSDLAPAPVSFSVQYVRNLGASVDLDTGYAINAGVGEISEAGDSRMRYRFSVVDKDAVLTAFSHDNTTFASNYREHALMIDYALTNAVLLNLTAYRYRRKLPALESYDGPNKTTGRYRINIQYAFKNAK